jgi:hypothetical protein
VIRRLLSGPTRLPRQLVAALAAAAIVVGCGSSENAAPSESSAPAGTVPQAGAHRAELVCSQAVERLKRIPPVHISTYFEVVPRIVRNERALARQLEAVAASVGGRSQIRRLATLFDRQAKEIGGALDSYGASQAIYERQIRRIRGLDEEIGKVARAIGAKDCARAPSRSQYL